MLLAPIALMAAVACSQAAPELGAPDPSTPDLAPDPTIAAVEAPTETPAPRTQAPSGPPPRLDTSVASVDLEDVVFDTFRGGFVPLSEATPALVDSLRDAIKPIYVPRYDGIDGGDWLGDGDLVLGYVTDSGAYAYPIKILNLHEIVNDVIDGEPVLVSYCPLCASGIVFSRELDGDVLVFGNTSALYHSDLVMYDHQTGSYWFQVGGEAIVGPLTGKRLTLLPSVTVPWKDWRRLHPNSKVLSKDLGLVNSLFGNPYDRDPLQGYADSLNRGRFPFPVNEELLDARLPAGQIVFAIELAGAHKGFPLSERRDEVINDRVGGQSVVVFSRAAGPSASAYRTDVEGEALAFFLEDGIIRDSITGSTWDDTGRAIDGPLTGTRLRPVPSLVSYWFAMTAAIPGIELYAPGG